MRPSILFLTTKFPPAPGGAGVMAYKIAEKLSNKYDITILTAEGNGENVRKIWTPSSDTFKSFFFTLSANIVVALKKCDLVHFHDFTSSIGNLIVNLAVKYNKKTILKYGGDFVYEYLLHKKVSNWNPSIDVEGAWSYNNFTKLLTLVERESLRHVDFIHSNSKYGIRLLNKLGIIEKISLIRNGVDLNVFNPRKYDRVSIRNELGLSGIVYFTAARFVPWKGLDILIKAFSEVKGDLILLIGGSGPENIKLRAMAKKDKRIRFIGSIPWKKIPLFLAASDVYVLPSFFEWCPNSLLEAMAMGKKIIASKAGGIMEVVDEKCGMLVPPGDINCLKKAIESVEEIPSGKKARKKILKECNLDSVILKIDKMYREVLG